MDIKRRLEGNSDSGYSNKRRKTANAPSFLEEMELEEAMLKAESMISEKTQNDINKKHIT